MIFCLHSVLQIKIAKVQAKVKSKPRLNKVFIKPILPDAEGLLALLGHKTYFLPFLLKKLLYLPFMDSRRLSNNKARSNDQ